MDDELARLAAEIEKLIKAEIAFSEDLADWPALMPHSKE